jgi:hypothetical protein
VLEASKRRKRVACDLLVAFVRVVSDEFLSRVHDAVEETRTDYSSHGTRLSRASEAR